MEALTFLILIVVCLGIMGASFCRVDMVEPWHNRWWNAVYIGFAACALGMLIEISKTLLVPNTGELFGIAGIALNLILTRKSWRDGAPAIVKGFP